MTAWLLVGLGVLLTIGTALFVAGEFSLVSVDRLAVERAVEEGDRRAEGVLAAVRSLSTQLSGAQVGITLFVRGVNAGRFDGDFHRGLVRVGFIIINLAGKIGEPAGHF